MKNKLLAISGSALLAACSAALPPPELVEARAAYAKASATSVGAPAAIQDARVALDRAEHDFRSHGDTPRVRTLAYVAARKAQTAEAAENVARDIHAESVANREIAQVNHDKLREGARLPRDTGEALVYTAGALQRAAVARAEDEQRGETSVSKLHRVASVRVLGDGFVVKLPAPTVFGDSDKQIDDAARAKLDVIARTILEAAPDAAIRIESHADSGVWGDLYDRTIAQRRANAIADYLASCGVPRERMTAVGFAPRHLSPQAADYDFHGLERRIDIVVRKPIALATAK